MNRYCEVLHLGRQRPCSQCLDQSPMLEFLYGYNLRMFVVGLSVCPWQDFQPSLMFESKAGAYFSGAVF